jgi:hypothetical protein
MKYTYLNAATNGGTSQRVDVPSPLNIRAACPYLEHKRQHGLVRESSFSGRLSISDSVRRRRGKGASFLSNLIYKRELTSQTNG